MIENKIIEYYLEAWFKIEYEICDYFINFKAWRIFACDEENPDQSTLENDIPNIIGYIKWDGCMNFEQNDHYCGIYYAEQVLLLMQKIYEFNSKINPDD